MKKFLILLILLPILSGCYYGKEPNDIAYVVAMGFDKGENGNYNITIQYAKPTQISGGASEEGGKGGETLENMKVESPTVYGAINVGNQIISKQFSLAHAKLFIFSEEVAADGVGDILQVMSRSEEIRPDVYVAVARGKASEYLNQVKPTIEINPAKYYQLMFNGGTGTVPKITSEQFYVYNTSRERDCAIPLAGVAKEKEESSGGGSGSSGGSGGESGSGGGSGSESGSGGGSGGESQGGGGSKESESNKEPENELQKQAPINSDIFQYGLKNYKAGEAAIEFSNKSEIMGSAVFRGDKYCGSIGSVETELYNILIGNYIDGYAVFKSESAGGRDVSIRMAMDHKPKISVDTSGDVPKIKINIDIDADFKSLPNGYIGEEDIPAFEKTASEALYNSESRFLERLRDEFQADIVGFGSYAKRNFASWKEYNEYNWQEKYKHAEFDLKVKVKIRHTGLTMKSA